MKHLLNRYKILFILYIPFFIFILVICLTKTKCSITTTGSITDLSSIFTTSNNYNTEGSLNSVFVYDNEKITIFQKFVGKLDKNATVYEPTKNYSLFTSSEVYRMGVIQKNQSLEASAIYAYKKANLIDSSISIDYNFLGYIVSYYIKSDDQQFALGDIITKINGVEANDSNFHDAYVNMMEGSVVEVLRNNTLITLTLNSASANYIVNDKIYSHISYYKKYNVSYSAATPALNISKIDSIGPSAGLMQTLAIYNSLISDDITKGRTIVGTGTIDEDGNVGEIGGIEQKVVAAFKNKADVFLCPEDNYEDGYNQYLKLGRKKRRMKFVMVSSFDTALEALND